MRGYGLWQHGRTRRSPSQQNDMGFLVRTSKRSLIQEDQLPDIFSVGCLPRRARHSENVLTLFLLMILFLLPSQTLMPTTPSRPSTFFSLYSVHQPSFLPASGRSCPVSLRLHRRRDVRVLGKHLDKLQGQLSDTDTTRSLAGRLFERIMHRALADYAVQSHPSLECSHSWHTPAHRQSRQLFFRT
ncbi:hypothetical protein CPB85DRAFT_755467 [Mucidula mucida]|nr:hypothetical protein CPB85DRAFT_755467 [Mucidula mucida]